MFTLTNEIIFHVPSTKNVSSKITNKQFINRTHQIASEFTSYFGGAGIRSAEGFYKSNDGKEVIEDIHEVRSLATSEAIEQYKQIVLDLAGRKARAWGQESILVEIDGIGYFVEGK